MAGAPSDPKACLPLKKKTRAEKSATKNLLRAKKIQGESDDDQGLWTEQGTHS